MKRMMFAALLLTIAAHACADDELQVLAPQPDGVAPGNLLEVHLKQQFYQQLDDRRAAFEQL